MASTIPKDSPHKPADTLENPKAGHEYTAVRCRARVRNDREIRNMRIALYQPDIPQNTGTILRLAACLGLSVDII